MREISQLNKKSWFY